MKMRRFENGFALPTILISSVVMLIVLVSAVAAVASVRASLDQQYYNQLAREAAESGIVRAIDCLKNNNYVAQWTNFNELWPNSACIGGSYTCKAAGTCLMQNKAGYRVFFRVIAPEASGDSQTIISIGMVEMLRPNGTVYREYGLSASARAPTSSSVSDVDIILFDRYND